MKTALRIVRCITNILIENDIILMCGLSDWSIETYNVNVYLRTLCSPKTVPHQSNVSKRATVVSVITDIEMIINKFNMCNGPSKEFSYKCYTS